MIWSHKSLWYFHIVQQQQHFGWRSRRSILLLNSTPVICTKLQRNRWNPNHANLIFPRCILAPFLVAPTSLRYILKTFSKACWTNIMSANSPPLRRVTRMSRNVWFDFTLGFVRLFSTCYAVHTDKDNTKANMNEHLPGSWKVTTLVDTSYLARGDMLEAALSSLAPPACMESVAPFRTGSWGTRLPKPRFSLGPWSMKLDNLGVVYFCKRGRRRVLQKELVSGALPCLPNGHLSVQGWDVFNEVLMIVNYRREGQVTRRRYYIHGLLHLLVLRKSCRFHSSLSLWSVQRFGWSYKDLSSQRSALSQVVCV